MGGPHPCHPSLATQLWSALQTFARTFESLERAAPHLFGPCTPQVRTWDIRPGGSQNRNFAAPRPFRSARLKVTCLAWELKARCAMRLANLCLAVALAAAANASIGEEQVTKSDLPAAVQKTADAQGAGATVLGYARNKEHGRVQYEVRL